MSQKCKNCEANIMHYELTYKDFALFKKLGKQQKTILAETDLSNVIVFKNWGFEYMIYEDKDCCGWFLHINKHSGTSLHCHETKQTVVCVISGMLLLTTATRRQLMQSGDIAYIDKKVFHAMGAASEDTRVIEIEMPSYKPDALRAVDFWGRVGQPYESQCLIMELQNPPKYEMKKREIRKEAKTN